MTSLTFFVLLFFLVSNYFMSNKYTAGSQSYMVRHSPDILWTVALSTYSFSWTSVLFKHCLLDTKYIKLTFYYVIQWTPTNMGFLTFSSMWYLGNVYISFTSLAIIVFCCPNSWSFPQLWHHVLTSFLIWKSWRISLCLNI